MKLSLWFLFVAIGLLIAAIAVFVPLLRVYILTDTTAVQFGFGMFLAGGAGALVVASIFVDALERRLKVR